MGALQVASPQEELLAPMFHLGGAVLSQNIANPDAHKWLSWMQTPRCIFKLLPTREAKEFKTIASPNESPRTLSDSEVQVWSDRGQDVKIEWVDRCSSR